VPARAESEIRAALRGGRPLEIPTRLWLEPRLGEPLGDVRVHSDPRAGTLADAVAARAFAVGSDVFFANGHYRPGTPAGDRLIAHEAVHVLQQRQAGSGPLTVSNPTDAGELEAESIADAVVSEPGDGCHAGWLDRPGARKPAVKGQATLRRAVHSDADLFKKMQEFRSHNEQLTTDQQNKIFWSVKKATDSDEVAYKFFDYYSGSFGQRIYLMSAQEEAKATTTDTLATTKPNSDTYLRKDALALPNETLGPLLIHEFSHTGQNTNFVGSRDYEEGQSYGIEYFYAEHTGDTARMAKIISIVSSGTIALPMQVPQLKENFKITYALMVALRDLTKSASSTLPPLAGKTGDDGRLMSAQFIASVGNLSGDVKALWDYVKAHLTTFHTPDI
jgi:hypothetical protein